MTDCSRYISRAWKIRHTEQDGPCFCGKIDENKVSVCDTVCGVWSPIDLEPLNGFDSGCLCLNRSCAIGQAYYLERCFPDNCWFLYGNKTVDQQTPVCSNATWNDLNEFSVPNCRCRTSWTSSSVPADSICRCLPSFRALLCHRNLLSSTVVASSTISPNASLLGSIGVLILSVVGLLGTFVLVYLAAVFCSCVKEFRRRRAAEDDNESDNNAEQNTVVRLTDYRLERTRSQPEDYGDVRHSLLNMGEFSHHQHTIRYSEPPPAYHIANALSEDGVGRHSDASVLKEQNELDDGDEMPPPAYDVVVQKLHNV